jgi:hypothetical protein
VAVGWGRLADWKLLAVGVEVVVAGACVVLGWQLVHGRQAGPPVTLQAGVGAPAPPISVLPRLPVLATGRGVPVARRPGVAEILQRVNRDDSGLYRGQWATIQLLGRATRDYLERHVVPLLLAAARGGKH